MNKIDKPKILNHSSFIDIIGIIGFIISVVQFLIPEKILPTKIKAIIFISSFILLLIIYGFRYFYKWSNFYKKYLKFYKEYEETKNRHLELSSQYDKRMILIKEQKQLLDEYKYILSQIHQQLAFGFLQVTDYEKDYLKNLYDITYKSIEHLNKLEGGNE